MLIENLISLNKLRKKLNEDYTSGPWVPPNDTSYVGFFFEKDVNHFSKGGRERYEAMKEAIQQKEDWYRAKYGDDWRNVAVHSVYRLMKESEEEGETPPVEVRIGDDLMKWDSENKEFVFSRKAELGEGVVRKSPQRLDFISVVPTSRAHPDTLGKRKSFGADMDLSLDQDYEKAIELAKKYGEEKYGSGNFEVMHIDNTHGLNYKLRLNSVPKIRREMAAAKTKK